MYNPEFFVDVPGYEQYLSVNAFGDVFSKRSRRLYTQRLGKGYPFITLSIDNRKEYPRIHRLVALCFLANPDSKPEVNHLDGNTENACVWNLEWSTRLENQQHAFRNNLARTSYPERRNLTPEAVRLVRIELTKGRSLNSIGRSFNVDAVVIQKIRDGRTYKDVK